MSNKKAKEALMQNRYTEVSYSKTKFIANKILQMARI